MVIVRLLYLLWNSWFIELLCIVHITYINLTTIILFLNTIRHVIKFVWKAIVNTWQRESISMQSDTITWLIFGHEFPSPTFSSTFISSGHTLFHYFSMSSWGDKYNILHTYYVAEDGKRPTGFVAVIASTWTKTGPLCIFNDDMEFHSIHSLWFSYVTLLCDMQLPPPSESTTQFMWLHFHSFSSFLSSHMRHLRHVPPHEWHDSPRTLTHSTVHAIKYHRMVTTNMFSLSRSRTLNYCCSKFMVTGQY